MYSVDFVMEGRDEVVAPCQSELRESSIHFHPIWLLPYLGLQPT